MRYLFSIADRGRNGYLSKDDLLELLHCLMGTTLRYILRRHMHATYEQPRNSAEKITLMTLFK